ncbi:MAG: hypothetical protein J7559_16880, partial [Cohnella sp.]|nr:hypothetical protein [Cohnella sp.]
MGRPFDYVCKYLELDDAALATAAKRYALHSLYEELRQLTARQVDLMLMYYDHTVLGYPLGDLLEEMVYLDSTAYLHAYENAILYLNDAGYGEQANVSLSTLPERARAQALRRLFDGMPFNLDEPESATALDNVKRNWYKQGGKSAAAFRFFSHYVKQDQYLHPHPNDVLSGNRRTRMLQQYETFRAVLKDVAVNQRIAEDLRRYESELHPVYLHYASAKIEASGLLAVP